MRESKRKQKARFRDPQGNCQQFYDPLLFSPLKPTIKHNDLIAQLTGKSLFGDNEVQSHVLKQYKGNQPGNKSAKVLEQQRLSKVLKNTKFQRKVKSHKLQSERDLFDKESEYDFNTVTGKIAYSQTPKFKQLLNSPFTKFNLMHKKVLDSLSKSRQQKINCDPVNLNTSPLEFYDPQRKKFSAAKFFIGLALFIKEKYSINDCLFFCKLACYADPCNQICWKKYISLEQERGNFKRAGILAKTGFIFTSSQDIAKMYLTDTDKLGKQIPFMQDLLASLDNPQVFQKAILPESAKIQSKHKQVWKGIKILYQLCCHNDFRLVVCGPILFLCKYLENNGYIDVAIMILRRSFSKSMSKLQIYTTYFDMTLRKNGVVSQAQIDQLVSFSDCIAGQNRYKLFLQLAEYFYYRNDSRFYTFIQYSFVHANKGCAPGSGLAKALRLIYFTIAKLKNVPPFIQHGINDQIVFQKNRYNFINGHDLMEYDFGDWKYYLHFGLVKRHDILNKALKKWPSTGRLIAEWIHCLRTFKPPLTMLKIWRQKIQHVPKSGQLWCEGGRIYAQLGEFNNASKCFHEAIHFTPQYGDSFIEELRLLLRQGRYKTIQTLKKLFLFSDPFYGQVLSFVKLNHNEARKLSMNQVWQNAQYELKKGMYSCSLKNKQQAAKRISTLTAYKPYNDAYLNISTPWERSKLFIQYEQMDNRN